MTKQLTYALGIETSCDETAAAIVNNKYNIISNIIFSQQKIHAPYFGVVPELASRTHYEKIHFVLEKALKNFDIKKLNLIAYTEKPGLKGALLVGKTVAKTLGYIYSIPVVGVDHLWGHINSVILSYKNKIKFPFLSLIISGGHTELSIVYSHTEREVLGETRDDACGEAFDKVAKMLNNYLINLTKTKKTTKYSSLIEYYLKILKYPGGPAIEKLAKFGNPNAIKFPRPYMLESWDFSFSGIKTAVLYFVKEISDFQPQLIPDICASFQESIVDTLMTKVLYTTKKFKCGRICVSGGVASNKYLRKKFLSFTKKNNLEIYFPIKELTTDNAAMIATTAIHFSNLLKSKE